MIVITGTVRFPAENLEAAKPHIQALVDATRQEDGCIDYRFSADMFDKGLIHIAEVWRDAAALTAHTTAPHIAPWRAAGKELGVHERKLSAFDADNQRSV